MCATRGARLADLQRPEDWSLPLKWNVVLFAKRLPLSSSFREGNFAFFALSLLRFAAGSLAGVRPPSPLIVGVWRRTAGL